MKSKFGIAAITMTAALAAGCATSTVEEEPAPVEVVAAPTPAPAPTPTPTPAPVVVERTGPLPGSLEDFTVNVGSKVYFDVDQYNLDAQDRDTLARQAAWLNTYANVTVLVGGNCDERGTREYNIALGERRATAAKDFLISQGVSASRIETVSYGKDRPVDPRSTPEAWAVNRNATVQIVSGIVG